MKNIISKVFSLIQVMIGTATARKSDKMIFAKNLPMAVKSFVMRNFPTKDIAFAEMRFTSRGMVYVAILNDGEQVVFNENGSLAHVA